jgi:hypothetical protein
MTDFDLTIRGGTVADDNVASLNARSVGGGGGGLGMPPRWS